MAKRLKPEGTAELLEEIATAIEALPDFSIEAMEACIRAMGEAKGTGMGPLVHPIRVAVSGKTEGPGLFEMLWLLGRERSLGRLRGVAAKLRAGEL